jgi:hypothetical protein
MWLLVGFLGVSRAWGAFEEESVSARSAALAESDMVEGGDAASLTVNPALLGEDGWVMSATEAVFPGLAALGRRNLFLSFRGTTVGGAAGWSDMGSELYRERRIIAGLSSRAGRPARLGAVLRRQEVSLRRWGRAARIDGDVGGVLRFGRAAWGGRCSIPGGGPLPGEGPLRGEWGSGVSYRIGVGSRVTAAVVRARGDRASGRVGMEVRLSSAVALRAGARTRPDVFAGGLSVATAHGRWDYAAVARSDMPLEHLLTFTLRRRRRS